MPTSADDRSPRVVLPEAQRCPTCRTKIVVPDAEGILVRNAILRVSVDTGDASAKCPRCKSWVEVPLRYQK
jgi:DNA-directed RNA polymerase subunit RPC12/RpoP